MASPTQVGDRILQASVSGSSNLALYASIAFGAANLIAVATSLTLAYRQLTRTHDWNRRKASHDILSQLASGDFCAMRGKLEADFGVRIWDNHQTYANASAALTTDIARAEFRFLVRTMLNYFETIAIGIKNYVLEDDICFDYAAEGVQAYWRWAKPLVDEVRPISPAAWTELEDLSARWAERQRIQLHKQKQSVRIPGRPRT